jgi:hypothetical protein
MNDIQKKIVRGVYERLHELNSLLKSLVNEGMRVDVEVEKVTSATIPEHPKVSVRAYDLAWKSEDGSGAKDADGDPKAV